ncbi:MAG: hydroxymethylbilane synthase [Thermoplasmatales archaeon B_DKE]|nr:MAG: hydroxymethylbilane synthase [Thermoplasmatales archaeon B_DKE]
MQEITLGTRPSKLALVQTELVRVRLSELGYAPKIVEHLTTGDRNREDAIYRLKGVGVFVRELNKLVLDGHVDCAVHSAKDLPAKLADGLEISAVLQREDPGDSLIADKSLDSLPYGAKIGTSSIRRTAELRSRRFDLVVKNIRGNIDTRISKYKSGEYDGILVATAAIKRLGISDKNFPLPDDIFVPAPNQGIIAVVSAKGGDASEILSKIDHAETRRNMEIERSVMQKLNLGCSSPVGIISKTVDDYNFVLSRFYSMDLINHVDFRGVITSNADLDAYLDSIKNEIPKNFGYGVLGV